MKTDAINKSKAAQFFERASIARRDSCWIWQGGIESHGYGYVTRGKKRVYAHRIAHEIAHGVILTQSESLHHDCCNKRCVNPAHLVAVTPDSHGLAHSGTHCLRGHRYIQHVSSRGRTRNICPTCRRSNKRAWRKRRRGDVNLAKGTEH